MIMSETATTVELKEGTEMEVQERRELKIVSFCGYLRNLWWRSKQETAPEKDIYLLTAEKYCETQTKSEKDDITAKCTHTHSLHSSLVWLWVLLFILLRIEAIHIPEISRSTVKHDQCALELNTGNSSK